MEGARDHLDVIEGAVEKLVVVSDECPILYLLDDVNEVDVLTVQVLRVLMDQLGLN